MKQKLLFIIMAIMMFWSATAMAGNLLTNGDFERVSGSYPDAWRIVDYYGYRTFPATIVTNDAASGQNSLKIEHTYSCLHDPACGVSFNGDWTTIAQSVVGVPFKPDTYYLLSFSYKTDSQDSFRFAFSDPYLIMDSSNGPGWWYPTTWPLPPWAQSTFIANDMQWHADGVPFLMTQNAIDNISNGVKPNFAFFWDYNTQGTFYLDNLVLQEMWTRAQVNFATPVAGTILDRNGLGTGLTHRLPGTGASFTSNDPNLDLQANSGVLTITSTYSDINQGGANLDTLEAIGTRLTGMAGNNFTATVTFKDVRLSEMSDQLLLYVGTDARHVFRAGLHVGQGNRNYMSVQSIDGGDFNWQYSPNTNTFAEGDTIRVTITRTTAATYRITYENLTAGTVWYDTAVFDWLDNAPELFVGVHYANNGASWGNNPKISQVSDFRVATLDRSAPITTASISGTKNTTGWYTTPVTVTLNATDEGFGVKEIRYAVDGGAETVVAGSSASVTLSANGTHLLTYHAVDVEGNVESVTSLRASVTITGNGAVITTTTLSDGTTGTAYSQKLAVTGGTAPYTWSVTGGALPVGLRLDGPTGVILGTPNAVGSSSFVVTARDAKGVTTTSSLTIDVYDPLTFSTATLPSGVVSWVYSAGITATGGKAPYNFAVTTGTLPAGLTLNSTDGTISGTPTTVATAAFTITATDARGRTVKNYFSIATYNPLVIVTTTLPAASMTARYTGSLAATGGKAPYTWSAAGLPAGLTINAISGKISGTPAKGTTGKHSVDVYATDRAGQQTWANFLLVVESGWIVNPATKHSYRVANCGTWLQCEAVAVAAGAHLVAINSAAEETWLKTTFGSSYNYWIGFTDDGHEGTWVWSNGDPVTYTNWYDGEPNNVWNMYPEGENFAQMNFIDGRWNDVGPPTWFSGDFTMGIFEK